MPQNSLVIKLKFMKNLISRIRWNVVISIVTVIVLIVIAVLFFKPFTPPLKCSDGVCIQSRAEPGEVGLKGESTLWVDIMNRGNEDLIMEVKLKTRNVVLFFEETYTQDISREIELGPGESMKLNFNVKANASYPGTYRTDITAIFNNERIESEVYLKVQSTKTSSS